MMETLINLDEMEKAYDTNEVARMVFNWGKRILQENDELKKDLERFKENKFNWYERENLLPLPDDMPVEKKIKNLTWRLWQAKKANKQLKQSSDATIEKLNKELQDLRDKQIKATKFEYDETSYDGLIYFSNNIRTYLLSGLKHMKSCVRCLEHTCPAEIRYKKDENGKFIKKVESLGSETYIWTGYEENPDYIKDWGTILNKMIKALELKEKYFESCKAVIPESDEKKIAEGMELLIKYQNEFMY